MDVFLQTLVNAIASGALYAILALGFSITYRATKFFDIAYGAYIMVGAYGAIFFHTYVEWPLVVSIGFGIMIAGLFGYGAHKTVYQYLQKQKANNLIFLVASLGLFTLVQALLSLLFSPKFLSLGESANSFQFLNVIVTGTQLLTGLSAFLVAISLIFLLRKTFLGKTIRAISDDAEVATVVGINTKKIIGVIFFVGASIGGLAGILATLDTGMDPTRGMILLLKGVVASISGGLGSIPGAIIGGLIVGGAESFGVLLLSSEWKDAIAFSILILFLLVRPQGIFGNTLRKS